ncbi:hypothetical protein K1719_039344 [Acacia pycnantha]|nr:hypothetical protein K1719_039344 [Acacia pycnantha]
MDQRRNCANAWSLPISDTLYDSSTMRNEREPKHHRLGVVLNDQGLPHSSERRWPKKLVHASKIKFGTWSIGNQYGRSREVIGLMEKRKINIVCLEETK